MRRTVNRVAISLSPVLLVVGLSLSGCGGGGSDPVVRQDPPPAVSGMLRKVTSAAELETSLRTSLLNAAANGVGAGPPSIPTVDVSAFTTTNTVEAGVDEFDTVRYDGSYIYVAPLGFVDGQIRILRTDSATGQATTVGVIATTSGENIQGMYVANGRLLTMTGGTNFLPFGPLWDAISAWAPTNMKLRVYDVSDPAHPRELLSAELDGVFVASRRIDDRVYIVSRHTPRALIDPADRPNLANLPLARLLPHLRTGGRESNLVSATDCYITNDSARPGYPVLTTITMLSLQNPAALDSTCYNEPADGVYASRTALYISQPRVADDGATSSRIHKFALGNGGPNYSGSVEVAGALWSGGQNDFRMNEYNGDLRVLTTEWTQDAADNNDHHLYVLRQRAAEPALEIIGRLPNDLHPAEIGKPGENLYGVRFAGDRAYGVTFRRIDPLYVFDLSNPADPRIAGELEVPGVSDYLHPVTNGLLLGIGSDAGRVKVELFDASVLSNPQSRGAVLLGNYASHSEATWDHHAIAYLPGTTDRLAFPALIIDRDANDVQTFRNELHQFEVAGKQVPASSSLRDAGAVVVPPPGADYVSTVSRSFIDGDTVWYVHEGKVWSSHWLTPGQVRGPF